MTSICNGSISSIIIFGYYKFYTTVRSQYLPIVLSSLNGSEGMYSVVKQSMERLALVKMVSDAIPSLEL